MSLVLGYCDEKHAIIASDGRAGGTVCPSESYDKTRRINQNIIMGFTGYKEPCEYFIKCTYMEMGDNVQDYFIECYLEIVEYGLNLPEMKEYMQSTFMIIGKTRDMNMRFVLVGESTGYEIKDVSIKNPSISFIGGYLPTKAIREICTRHISEETEPISIMKNIIIEVSSLDSSVNTNCFFKSL